MSDFPKFYNKLFIDGIQYNAEMTKPGYMIIRCGDEVCGDVEIDLYRIQAISHNVNSEYSKVIDQIVEGMNNYLEHLGQWYDALSKQWYSYDLHPTDQQLA